MLKTEIKLSRNVLKLSPESIKSLYNVLEVTFDPLSLCASIAPLLQTLSADEAYSPYLSLLQRALLSRLLSQLSQVYSTIKISSLLALVTPLKDVGLEGSFDEEQVEAYIMGCARRGELNVRVDHKDGSITFVDDPFVPNDDALPSTSASSSSSSSSVAREVSIQPSTADLVRTRLSRVAICLRDSLNAIEEKPIGPTAEEQATTFKNLVIAVESERKALQLRRALVARRRELLSELSVRKEKEESSRRAELSRREKEEDERRLREDLKRKEVERTKKEIETIRIDVAKKYAQSLVDKGILKPNDVDVSYFFFFSRFLKTVHLFFPFLRNWRPTTRKVLLRSKLLSSKKRRRKFQRGYGLYPSVSIILSVHIVKKNNLFLPRTTKINK